MTSVPGTALVTGGAKRLGKAIATRLHQRGYELIIHYQNSEAEALALCEALNAIRAGSVQVYRADLAQAEQVAAMASWVAQQAPTLSCLVNNASVFDADALHQGQESAYWQQSMQVNAHAAYQLSQGLQAQLSANSGCIVNLVDIYAERPLAGHSLYCASKAANAMLVKSLALELAPSIRVNGIAPGAILWPDQQAAEPADTAQPFEALSNYQQSLLKKVPLARLGSLDAITQALEFMLDCHYLTGQIINIDGGRSLMI